MCPWMTPKKSWDWSWRVMSIGLDTYLISLMPSTAMMRTRPRLKALKPPTVSTPPGPSKFTLSGPVTSSGSLTSMSNSPM